ncbi:DUF6214 family protein [Streptomyces albospinus]|uniref:DUF6214 family protein n=1 Tax=Streptomyces albospinus TaxID=285515 RepID=UPI00166F7435
MEWPSWELRAHGSAAPELGPWFSARLTFVDGARIDVLVTTSDDHLTVEDVRADPPLTLDALAALARWIDGPLDDACRAATGRPPKSPPVPESTAGGTAGKGDGGVLPGEQRTGTSGGDAPAEGVVRGEGALCGTGTGTPLGAPADAPPDPVPGETASGASADPADPADAAADAAAAEPVSDSSAAARSAVLVRSRASERRKLAADAYRAAQKDGRDPVLAVMTATGRNRRRALRLIAGARDAGLLTPRHNKR